MILEFVEKSTLVDFEIGSERYEIACLKSNPKSKCGDAQQRGATDSIDMHLQLS